MKEFDVTITETLKLTVSVEASSKEEAQQMVSDQWHAGDHILDADNFVEVEFESNDGKEISVERAQDDTLEVLMVEPGQYPRVERIGSDLASLQKAVDGYAEIKALCAGDKRIKEKMDLDVDVARLKLMKASHQSQQFRLEDNLLRHFPEQIRQNESFVEGFTADMQTLAGHPHPVDGFAGMEVKGDLLTDKDNAGAAILEAFKDAKGMEPVPIGSYRGFAMSLTVEDFGRDFILTLKGKMNHRVTLGKDARGNLTRIDNALNAMPDRLQNVRNTLDALTAQMETAKAELGKPFPQEDELRTKSARLAELNAELNIDDRTPMEQMAEDAPAVQSAKAERPSVLAKLKAPLSQPCAEDKIRHRDKEER